MTAKSKSTNGNTKANFANVTEDRAGACVGTIPNREGCIMKTWEIVYLSNEGRVVRTTVETEDEGTKDAAIWQAYEEDYGYGDGIHKIIDCEEK